MNEESWFRLKSPDDVLSPALLFYPNRIRENIGHMIAIAGNPERLWPHIKTHKSAEIVQLQQEFRIERFKCSTLSEALLLGKCKVKKGLLAMQPTAVHLDGLLRIMERFQNTEFSTLVDNERSLEMMSQKARSSGIKLKLWIDLNNGMNRTGVEPGPRAEELFKKTKIDPWVECLGLHVYDGHIHDSDREVRERRVEAAMEPVVAMIGRLTSQGIHVGKVIAGGSPSFPVHAKNPNLDLSPGTTLLWDAGYGEKYADLPFKPAAALLTRVISEPAESLITTDLGHKSVASEMPFPRVRILNTGNCEQVSQSEEHLVLRCKGKTPPRVGEVIYALPVHICPTVSKYAVAHVVEEHSVQEMWQISARDHNVELSNS